MKYRYKVLLVHEKQEVLDTLKEHLEMEGYTAETIQGITEAFERIISDKYHVVLLGLDMPHQSGLELLKEIKKYDPMTQVIVMAEESTMDTILSALEYGANDYVHRPQKDEAYIKTVVNDSVQKLERWRDAIQQIVL